MQMQMHCKAMKRSDGRERTTVGDSAPFDERDVSWELSKSVCEATGRRAPTARPRMPVWPSLTVWAGTTVQLQRQENGKMDQSGSGHWAVWAHTISGRLDDATSRCCRGGEHLCLALMKQ